MIRGSLSRIIEASSRLSARTRLMALTDSRRSAEYLAPVMQRDGTDETTKRSGMAHDMPELHAGRCAGRHRELNGGLNGGLDGELNGGLNGGRVHRAGALSPASALPWKIPLLAGISGGGLALLVSSPLSASCVAATGVLIPCSWQRRRLRRSAEQFSRDYPTMLIAMASSLRAGLSIQEALQRSVVLLPRTSATKREVEKLLDRLQREGSRERSVRAFGAESGVPEAELFRIATLIALEHGGSLGNALDRLARVAAERRALIEAAQVSTANMKMTANILLGVAPFLIATQLSRSPETMHELLNHPTAQRIAGAGAALIVGGYATLRHLSDFKP